MTVVRLKNASTYHKYNAWTLIWREYFIKIDGFDMQNFDESLFEYAYFI